LLSSPIVLSSAGKQQAEFMERSGFTPGIGDVVSELDGTPQACLCLLPHTSPTGDRSLNAQRVDQADREPLASRVG
jgi:hypothetical protein